MKKKFADELEEVDLLRFCNALRKRGGEERTVKNYDSAIVTSNIQLLDELSVDSQPLWGDHLALGPSGLGVLILVGAVGRASFASLVPGIEARRRPIAAGIHRRAWLAGLFWVLC